jgi:hypothetical protein
LLFEVVLALWLIIKGAGPAIRSRPNLAAS